MHHERTSRLLFPALSLCACVLAAGSAGAGCSSTTTIVAAQPDGGPSSGDDGDDGGGGAAATGDAAPGTGASKDGALAIASLTTTSPTLFGGDTKTSDATSVTFVAIVTDADGLDAIAGGQLTDDGGTSTARSRPAPTRAPSPPRSIGRR